MSYELNKIAKELEAISQFSKITKTFFENDKCLIWKLETNVSDEKYNVEKIQNIAWKELKKLENEKILKFYEDKFDVFMVGNPTKYYTAEVDLISYIDEELQKELKKMGFKIIK